MATNIHREFYDANAAYLLSLFVQYQEDPQTVDASIRVCFRQHAYELQQLLEFNGEDAAKTAVSPSIPLAKIKAAVQLGQAIREYGHLVAQLDPLGTPPPGELQLSPT
jgi:2-oxoglutarate dehydrogenase E1 component